MVPRSPVPLIFLLALLMGCDDLVPASRPKDQLLDGPVDGLSFEENRRFQQGDIAFNGQIFTSTNGLGPLFVASSCGSCHAGDGKGHPSTTLTRFGQIDETGNQYLASGGPQLQHRSISGYLPEELPEGVPSSKFTPPANTGLGFIEFVSDADIIALADPEDADGDGISGIVNWITLKDYVTRNAGAIEQNGKYIGRFGKKAAVHNLLQQTVNAYQQDIGITSSYEPYDNHSGVETDAEISNATINNVVFYLRTLKAPIQRNQESESIMGGKVLFVQAGCEKCHKASLKTQSSSISAISQRSFSPYTDLLLHDMGPKLDDGYTEGSAKTFEWRTAPLWGLGLSQSSQGGQFYLLHDGRARSIEDAILQHGGEATASSKNYEAMSRSEKDLLITFLKSL
ncbi:MAG: di-heme oxidoredictase family protein [Chryseolinea sp.]